ncbi:MAG: NYN domain-containing protein [Spirochaetaceae bacterium]|nr:MAG: NYN domain-containing protein [Spirochaetaceae bacterium]
MIPFDRIAILVDGGFFLKRLPKVLGTTYDGSVDSTTKQLNRICRSHVEHLTGRPGLQSERSLWRRYVHRILYYDAMPYDGKSQHPFSGKAIDFSTSDVAIFRREFFDSLRRQPKVALRLGTVVRDGDWRLSSKNSHRVLRTRALVSKLTVPNGADALQISGDELRALQEIVDLWNSISLTEPSIAVRQKGVDMRLGLDIASIAYKRLATTIVLVTGDSDFVPAAKLARREGLEIILDPLWQQIGPELFEHIDGLRSGLPRPNREELPEQKAASDDVVSQSPEP